MTAIEFISQETGIPESNLEYIDGPDSGHGTDFWIAQTGLGRGQWREFYVTKDQDEWSYVES
jgi:hypothetical protein